MNKAQAMRVCKLDDATYYRYEADKEHHVKGKREISDERVKKMIPVIIMICDGRVPGHKKMKEMIEHYFDEIVDIDRFPKLYEQLGIQTSERYSDPYDGHATHDHLCTAFDNLVGRRFYRGVRRVILTDITYLYYSWDLRRFFKCTFIDAFTGEELGTAVSLKMDTALVIRAYKDMMAGHKGEFPEGAIIHSDQGSQYRSKKFRKMIAKDGFTQSMSNRGNSLDNAPMESYFGTFKNERTRALMDCEAFEEAARCVLAYKDHYNNERTHSGISGWIPSVFYAYCVAFNEGRDLNEVGAYAPQRKIDNLQQAIEKRLSLSKGYGTYDEEKEAGILAEKYQLRGGAEGQMDRDEKKLSREIKKSRAEIMGLESKIENADDFVKEKEPFKIEGFKDKIEAARRQIERYMDIQKALEAAREFFRNATEEIRRKLADSRSWREYSEMGYCELMDGMF